MDEFERQQLVEAFHNLDDALNAVYSARLDNRASFLEHKSAMNAALQELAAIAKEEGVSL